LRTYIGGFSVSSSRGDIAFAFIYLYGRIKIFLAKVVSYAHKCLRKLLTISAGRGETKFGCNDIVSISIQTSMSRLQFWEVLDLCSVVDSQRVVLEWGWAYTNDSRLEMIGEVEGRDLQTHFAFVAQAAF
jgi:hypothetical protein